MGNYAIIHVRSGPNGEAWPLVERVPDVLGGGWQSGAHHYPDASVLDVKPLTLVDPDELARLRTPGNLWHQPYVPHSGVDRARYQVAVDWPELRDALDAASPEA